MEIKLKITCKEFNFYTDEVLYFLNNLIQNCDRYSNLRFKSKIDQILKSKEIKREDLTFLKNIYLIYSKEVRSFMVERGYWYLIGNLNEAKSKENEYKEKAFSYSRYRYGKDYGWLGIYAEEKVKEFFINKLNVEIISWDKIGIGESWKDKVDRYDFKLCEKSFDVKCATKPHYVEITPKVSVEGEFSKDFYIVTKFFYDNNLYLVGFFEHKDIVSYGTDRRYGTDYYKVPIVDSRCLKELIKYVGC